MIPEERLKKPEEYRLNISAGNIIERDGLDMNMKAEAFQGEERAGYYVQPMMQRIWAVQLDLLKEIDRICKRHHIIYYGWFGTLLGAVRHHGFIPWDNDMDLAMLREDYERFRYHIRTELPDGWTISEHVPSLTCVFNTDTIWVDQGFLDKFHGCPYKTGIDIFCLDRVPKNEADERLQSNLFGAVCGLCMDWHLPEQDERWGDMGKWEYLSEIEKLSGHHFDRQLPIKEQLYFLGDRIAAMYWDAEYDHVTSAVWQYDHPHYHIPGSSFDRVIEVPFEDTTIPILEDYGLVCRATYGDNYMTPIIEDRHDYLKDQVEQLRKWFQDRGMGFPEAFDMKFE